MVFLELIWPLGRFAVTSPYLALNAFRDLIAESQRRHVSDHSGAKCPGVLPVQLFSRGYRYTQKISILSISLEKIEDSEDSCPDPFSRKGLQGNDHRTSTGQPGHLPLRNGS